MNRYGLEPGRTVTIDGEPSFRIAAVPGRLGRGTLPADLDRLAARIVLSLNEGEAAIERGYIEALAAADKRHAEALASGAEGWSDRPMSYGEVAAIPAAFCMSSPDGKGPHRPDDTTDPLTCAECGALIDASGEAGEDTEADAYRKGHEDGYAGLDTGLTYDNDPDSPRSEAYDRGRTAGEYARLREARA